VLFAKGPLSGVQVLPAESDGGCAQNPGVPILVQDSGQGSELTIADNISFAMIPTQVLIRENVFPGGVCHSETESDTRVSGFEPSSAV
jgi:hypothetical protein